MADFCNRAPKPSTSPPSPRTCKKPAFFRTIAWMSSRVGGNCPPLVGVAMAATPPAIPTTGDSPWPARRPAPSPSTATRPGPRTSRSFSKHGKGVFLGDAGALSTDGECSAATEAAAGRGGSRRALPVRPVQTPRIKYLFDLSHAFSVSLCLDSPATPPLDFRHRLTRTFFLECIASWRPSNWLHGGSRRLPPSRPLETWPGAPYRALRIYCGRWHDRGVVVDFAEACSFRW